MQNGVFLRFFKNLNKSLLSKRNIGNSFWSDIIEGYSRKVVCFSGLSTTILLFFYFNQ